ncbi:MAG TPA: formate dehydrogenase accessory sulfurtransferase FdhD [Methylomirabilota bacterium]|nr:formate dehydrogenase accessory sulfurtransferase FdhD [Methylomirabilota bacterium]
MNALPPDAKAIAAIARSTSVASAERVLPNGSSAAITEVIAEEVPVALVYNNISHAVMMATPADLADFGVGFSLSEGILAGKDELMDIGVAESEAGIEVQMAIAIERFRLLRERRRTLAGRTGCGICGVESLEQAVRPVPPVTAATTIPVDAIYAALAELPQRQAVNQLTRSVHAAAWISKAGQIQLVREDVGRHNALDKLIGAMAWRGVDPVGGFALITSRCSVEMVQKAATAGIPVLVAISAPTALARRMAEGCGLTLVALARRDSVLVVTHPRRILGAR